FYRTFAPKSLPPSSITLTFAVLTCWAAPAMAGSDFAGKWPSESEGRGLTASRQDDSNHLTLGLGVAALPQYQGSDDYEAEPVPIVDAQYGRFFIKSGEGIGMNIIKTPTFIAGASIDVMSGYDEDDVPDGIEELDSSLGARLFVSARFDGLVTTLAATRAVTESDRGLVLNAALAYPLLATERFTITPTLHTTWANDKYMNSYFGVDSSEAAASGLDYYQPESGFKNISLRVSASYRITESVIVLGAVGVTHLLGDAADSPLV